MPIDADSLIREAMAEIETLRARLENDRRANQINFAAIDAYTTKLHDRANAAEARTAEMERRLAEAVKALERADQFITNGVDLGFIRMPDADCPDTAHETPGIIREAIVTARALTSIKDEKK